MRLILQPCGDSDAKAHFVDTIQNKVPLAKLAEHLTPAEMDEVQQSFSNSVAVWGVTPAKNLSNAKAWGLMNPGDTTLLYRDKRFFYKATIAFKTRNEALAADLWSRKPDGSTWEYVFLLSDLEPVDIPIEAFNIAAGYAPNFVVQRFLVMDEAKSLSVIEGLDLSPALGPLVVKPSDTATALTALQALEGDLNASGNGVRRIEQSLLRKLKLGNKTSESCAICGEDLPVNLLAIGHIKKRASCTPAERKDLANVMPACYLGCDRLFENGYLYVDEHGIVRTAEPTSLTAALQNTLEHLNGLGCTAWNSASEFYFKWHRDHLPRPPGNSRNQ